MGIADYEIFREQLAIRYPSYGYALWEPRPRNPNKPVQVGDVGFILKGRFHRLFSALLPADDTSQEFGVPEYYEPLVPTLEDHLATCPLDPNNYCSVGVRAEDDPGYHSSPDDFPRVLFQNETTGAGAVLSLPVTARREDTLIGNVFGRYMVKHIDTWFTFARNLGLVHRMEDIILVTGCDLTRYWTNIAFLGGRADAQASFGVEVGGRDTCVNFQSSPEHSRGAVVRHGPRGANVPENQCVFIRGFRVARSKWILPKRLKAAAGPSSDPGGYDSDSDIEVISIPGITQFRDPLHLLSDYIAEQASDCDKILIHDDDLLMVDGIGHETLPETLEPDVMADLLEKSDIKIHKFECDSLLTESQSGPNTNTSNVRVATISMTFQNWMTTDPTPPSEWLPLAAQMTDLSHTSELRGTLQPEVQGNSSVPTLQRVSTKRKLSLLLEDDGSAPSTLQDLGDCAPLERGQSARHNHHETGSGARYSVYRTPNAMGGMSRLGSWPTHYSESPEGYGQDINSTVEHKDGSSRQQGSIPAIPRQIPPDNHASQASRVFRCPVCQGGFSRCQDRERHMVSHLPYWLQCPNGDCAWRGDRWEYLRRHRVELHHTLSNQEADRYESMIYDPGPLVEGMIKGEITPEFATQQATSFVEEKGRRDRKLKLWEGNIWGRNEREAQRVQSPDDQQGLSEKPSADDE